MFRACAVATIIAAGLAVAACGTDDAPTAPETGSAPSFRSEHAPPGRGAQVSHGDGGFFATFREAGAPYFVAIGLTARAAEEFCRGGDPELGASRSLFVERKNGGVHLLLRSVGKVPLLLYPAGTEDICDGSPHHVLVVVQSYLGPNGFVDRVRKVKVN